MRMKRLLCFAAAVVMLCVTTFAEPKFSSDVGTPVAVESVQCMSPADAGQTINHFEVTIRVARVLEVAFSPPDIAVSQDSATAIVTRKIWNFDQKAPPLNTAATRSDAQLLHKWTPNIGYEGRSMTVPPEYQTARSGSFE